MSVVTRLGKKSSIRVSKQRANCTVYQAVVSVEVSKEKAKKVKRKNGVSWVVL